jgi:Flp pilus assembly pilin Flp
MDAVRCLRSEFTALLSPLIGEIDLMFAKLSRSILGFLKREDGPTPVEYAIIFALALVGCVAFLSMFSTSSKPKKDARSKPVPRNSKNNHKPLTSPKKVFQSGTKR